MKKISYLFMASFAAIAVIASPVDASAQGRNGGSSSHASSSHSSPARSGGASHSSAPSRSSSPAMHSSAPSRSSSSAARSSAPSRSSSPAMHSSAPSRSSSPAAHSSAPSRSSSPAMHSSAPSRSSSSAARSSAPSRSSSPAMHSSAPSRSSSPAMHSSAPSRSSAPAHGKAPAARPAPGHHAAPAHAPAGVRFHNAPHSHVAPIHRDFIAHDRPGRFLGGHPHYFGYRVQHIPHGYIHRTYWGRPYYILDGIYYRPFGGYYVVCRPPYGVFYHPTVLDVALSAVRFSYYYDIWHNYNIVNSNWNTIEEQNRIIAANNAAIASQNAELAARERSMATESYSLASSLGLVQSYADANVKYYYEDGVFFIVNAKGEYEVIVPPAGALVNSLPDDYEEVTLGGNIPSKVDDTVYKMRIVDGAPCFEVLGQIVS